MSKNKLDLMNLLAISSMLDNNLYLTPKSSNRLSPSDIKVIPKQIKPKKGCKEFWFDADGNYTNGEDGQPRMRKDETVFYCHASNYKNAKRKFENAKS